MSTQRILSTFEVKPWTQTKQSFQTHVRKITTLCHTYSPLLIEFNNISKCLHAQQTNPIFPFSKFHLVFHFISLKSSKIFQKLFLLWIQIPIFPYLKLKTNQISQNFPLKTKQLTLLLET